MQKILIWGTGNTYTLLFPKIKQLEDNHLFQISALINKSGKNFLDGYKVISSADISCVEYDYIVICAEGEQAASILAEAKRMDISNKKIRHIEEFMIEQDENFEKLHSNVIQRQLNVINRILNASDNEINNLEWMLSCIEEYGIYPFERVHGKENRIKTVEGEESWGILQIPEEFAEFCCFINTLNIQTVAEVGVFKGRSSYFLCAILSRKNLEQYLCIDIIDCMDEFERFAELLPALKRAIPATTADYKGNAFDMVFIDADHSYDGSILDYYNLGQHAHTLTAFHDIYGHEYDHENGGTVRMWKEVLEDTKEKEHLIFSKYPEEWMGIGCVIW